MRYEFITYELWWVYKAIYEISLNFYHRKKTKIQNVLNVINYNFYCNNLKKKFRYIYYTFLDIYKTTFLLIRSPSLSSQGLDNNSDFNNSYNSDLDSFTFFLVSQRINKQNSKNAWFYSKCFSTLFYRVTIKNVKTYWPNYTSENIWVSFHFLYPLSLSHSEILAYVN